MAKVLRFKETERGPGAPIDEDERDDKFRERGIRCPTCKWRPRARDRWQCTCAHVWNTFDTRGRCPACGYQWQKTQCLACDVMSPHEAWYAKDD